MFLLVIIAATSGIIQTTKGVAKTHQILFRGNAMTTFWRCACGAQMRTGVVVCECCARYRPPREAEVAMQDHSPLPWKAEDTVSSPINELDTEHAIKQIVDAYGGYVADLDPQNEWDAAFIVRACNSHEGLVEACKQMVEWADHFDKNIPLGAPWPDQLFEAIQSIQAALATAEGVV